MSTPLRTISPIDGSLLVERELATDEAIQQALDRAQRAQEAWRSVTLAERAKGIHAFVDALLAHRSAIAEEITRQMGRPISQSPGELVGFEERARHMIELAPFALAEIELEEKPGFLRSICREPLGVVFVVAPWNYPYLTSVNAVVPALMAGNSVVLKHSAQTPLVAERYSQAARAAGLPSGLLQHLHLDHRQVAQVIQSPAVQYVAFTGSVAGGHAIHEAASKRFIATGLELGGKDPIYIRPDADFDHAVETALDGAFFNAGQSCCGTKRIYVHQSIYKRFEEALVARTYDYVLGNPLDGDTNLGPVVRTAAAEAIRAQVSRAIKAGAKALIDASRFPRAQAGTPYMAPQILAQVTHEMDFMREETFGPAVGLMPVDSDEQAVQLMNDSSYGLTAAVFSADVERAWALGHQLETGTFFLNRCDYLDPALAWVGVKNSGRGCTLSSVGYENLTRPKSFHLKVKI